MRRSAAEVLADHVRMREEGRLDADLERNYHADVVVLTGRRVFRGHDGMRECAAILAQAVHCDRVRFRTLITDDRMAFSEWTAEGEDARIDDGVDSYLIEDGCIVAQTIHYTVIHSRLSMLAPPGTERVRVHRA